METLHSRYWFDRGGPGPPSTASYFTQNPDVSHIPHVLVLSKVLQLLLLISQNPKQDFPVVKSAISLILGYTQPIVHHSKCISTYSFQILLHLVMGPDFGSQQILLYGPKSQRAEGKRECGVGGRESNRQGKGWLARFSDPSKPLCTCRVAMLLEPKESGGWPLYYNK